MQVEETREVAILTQELSLSFGGRDILEEISVGFPKNSVTALIGPSGSGKSTLLRSLNRMNDHIPDVAISGKVLFDGTDVYDESVDLVTIRTRIGMVFQRPNPFSKSIFDNVAYGPRIHGERSKKALSTIVEISLQRAGLWEEVRDRLEHSALSLSGGQQQRLCIARSLAVNPDVLLMDEPCSALDPAATQRVEDLIAELKKEVTVVIATHNLQQAARISDYTTFLLSGKLIEHDLTSVMFTAPSDNRTNDYITGRFG